jgi:L-rhamnose mutarotase
VFSFQTETPDVMKRIAFRMKLKPGAAAEYEKRHETIWPELKMLLKEAGISDYSIFLDEETGTLFAVQKIQGDQGSQDLGRTEVVQRWWAYMADLMETNPDNSPQSTPLMEVFHLD